MTIKVGLYRFGNKVVRVVEIGPSHKKVKVDWGKGRTSWINTSSLKEY